MTARERLKQARIEAGYKTVQSGADAVSMKLTAYYRLESGPTKLTLDKATHFARVFHKDVNWILTGKAEHGQDGGEPASVHIPATLPRRANDLIRLLRGSALMGDRGLNFGEQTFVLPMDDRAMVIPGKLHLGDWLAFDPEEKLRAGDLALVQLFGEANPIFRRYIPLRAKGCYRLIPFDSQYETHDIQPNDGAVIMGRFVFLIRGADTAY